MNEERCINHNFKGTECIFCGYREPDEESLRQPATPERDEAHEFVTRANLANLANIQRIQCQLSTLTAERDRLKAALLKIAMEADRRSAWCVEVAREALSPATPTDTKGE